MKSTHNTDSSILLSAILCGCRDNADEPYPFSILGETATRHNGPNSNFTLFSTVLRKSRISDKPKQPRSMPIVARGSHTCFISNNDAARLYSNSTYGHQSHSTGNPIECVSKNNYEDAQNQKDI